MSGAPAAEASHPGQDDADGELQAEAMSVPLRGQGGAATPLTDVGLLFAQNQSKLTALKVSIVTHSAYNQCICSLHCLHLMRTIFDPSITIFSVPLHCLDFAPPVHSYPPSGMTTSNL